MGLDRALMLRKGIDDIRLLRSGDPRVAAQMLDLAPWRSVSTQPPVRRDLSIVVDADLESVNILASTDYTQLPPAARTRLGLRPDQCNVLLSLVLRPLHRTLTDTQANQLRDRVYVAVHRGPHQEWSAR
jgi:phenylalanyl-tRNA synthetase alpha chain